jgi:hypothetical protein
MNKESIQVKTTDLRKPEVSCYSAYYHLSETEWRVYRYWFRRTSKGFNELRYTVKDFEAQP